ncbi:MAG: hypothetical protein ACRDRN_19875 [Sciscionella sp.]
MAAFTERITRFLRGPRGKELTRRAQQLARDPRTRRTVEQLRTRLQSRRR